LQRRQQRSDIAALVVRRQDDHNLHLRTSLAAPHYAYVDYNETHSSPAVS
jgi:hypothetical protein